MVDAIFSEPSLADAKLNYYKNISFFISKGQKVGDRVPHVWNVTWHDGSRNVYQTTESSETTPSLLVPLVSAVAALVVAVGVAITIGCISRFGM